MSEASRRKEVAIIQNGCPHYRVAFYDGLRDHLADFGIDLRLLYGVPSKTSQFSPVFYAELPWAEPFTPFYLPSRKPPPAPATWHPVLGRVLGADLVVVEAASRHLINYVLCLTRLFGGPRIAFWGHGWSHRSDKPRGLSERLKDWMRRRGDWYFAYTGEVKRRLIERGHDPSRISDVQNAIAAPPLLELSDSKRIALRKDLSIGIDDTVALYCGRMYADKRLGFLISAAELVHDEVPSFQLILAGSGPQEEIAEKAARRHSYVHFIGPVFGERKLEVFAVSDLFVIPGAVGLNVVDAFHHALPPVATSLAHHGPEFAYLKHGENGIVSADEVAAFSKAIVRLARDESLRSELIAGCRKSADEITIDEMIRRFGAGVVSALGMNPMRDN